MAKMKIKKLGRGAVQLKRSKTKLPLNVDSFTVGVPFFSIKLKSDLLAESEIIAEIDETASIEDLTRSLTQINHEITHQRQELRKQKEIVSEIKKQLNSIIQKLYSTTIEEDVKKAYKAEKEILNDKLSAAVEDRNDTTNMISSLEKIQKQLTKRVNIITKRRGKALASNVGDEKDVQETKKN